MKKSLIGSFLILVFGTAFGSGNKDLTISGIQVEIDNKKVNYDKSISKQLIDFESKEIIVYQDKERSYLVDFLYKRRGNRIKLRRKSKIILSNGSILRGNTKKEVQFMSSSAPGYFEFPVAENIVLDKKAYSTFFISYTVRVTYL